MTRENVVVHISTVVIIIPEFNPKTIRYIMICIPIIYVRIYTVMPFIITIPYQSTLPVGFKDSVAANWRASLSHFNHPRQRHDTAHNIYNMMFGISCAFGRCIFCLVVIPESTTACGTHALLLCKRVFRLSRREKTVDSCICIRTPRRSQLFGFVFLVVARSRFSIIACAAAEFFLSRIS